MDDHNAPVTAGADGDGSPAGLWSAVDGIWGWLEASRPANGDGEELLLRVLKLSEEVGEVAQAVVGVTGHNPRKGTTHTWQDVEAELCDVVITALVTLRTLTPDAREVFAGHLARVVGRSQDQPSPASPRVGGRASESNRARESRST
jgi:NTP pyrophosphatase (non-canonical NTP hydrolase)